MTGIERLRGFARRMDELSVWPGGAKLLDIAGQIERELREERDRWESDLYEAEVAWNRVLAVVTEMERHVSGVEGAEDSPVARWACELRRALKSDASDSVEQQKPSCADAAEAPDVTSESPKVTRDPSKDVSMSAYDLLPQEEREAIAWVREHGGMDAVKRHWECLSYYADPVPRAYAEKRIAKRQRQIDESHAALRRRNERIAELERRLSEAVSAQLASDAALYDMRRELRDVCEANGVEPGEDPLRAMERHVENLTAVVENLRLLLNARAMPEGMEWLVEAWPRFEDDVPLKFGDMALIDGEADMIEAVQLWIHGRPVIYGDGGSQQLERGERVKRPASKVLDADGAEIRVGDEVFCTNGHGPFEVTRIVYADQLRVICDDEKNGHLNVFPESITHRAPVIAADGKPLREGETVWLMTSGREIRVDKIEHRPEGFYALELFADGSKRHSAPVSILAHERPVADSWERIEEDADALAEAEINGEGSYNAANDYCTRHGLKDGTVWVLVAQDLVRRAKALAERDR